MAEDNDLRGSALYDRLIALRPQGLTETDWAEQAGVNRSFFSNLKGKNTSPRLDTLRKVLAHIGRTEADLYGQGGVPAAPSREPELEDLDMVGIRMIDLAYGLGATYADSAVQVDVVQFPKVWVEQITHSPPVHLTWTRGRGDSMSPTIEDGDMVLLDHSQTRVEEQDAMWAFAIGDINAIKRLRVKGDRFQIFSDNPNVPPDEEPQDFVNIVARVVFVGRRK